MIRTACIATVLLAVAIPASSAGAHERHNQARRDANGNLDVLIAHYAAANEVPEGLVRRIIHRESRGNPRAVSRGNYGLMQIRLPTARAMGYRGGARGLLNAETNMRYAVKYLAGAWRAAHGNADRAVHYYAAGYAAHSSGHRARQIAMADEAYAEADTGDRISGAQALRRIKLTNSGKAVPESSVGSSANY